MPAGILARCDLSRATRPIRRLTPQPKVAETDFIGFAVVPAVPFSLMGQVSDHKCRPGASQTQRYNRRARTETAFSAKHSGII